MLIKQLSEMNVAVYKDPQEWEKISLQWGRLADIAFLGHQHDSVRSRHLMAENLFPPKTQVQPDSDLRKHQADQVEGMSTR